MMVAASNDSTLETCAGADRYDVVRRIAEAECVLPSQSYKGVIICSCNEGKFLDALSAAGLSGLLDYPMLAVNGSGLTLFNRVGPQAIKDSCPSGSPDIIIVGDTAAVSQDVQTALGSFGKVSKRFAGAYRYEVNRLVYEYGASHGGWPSCAFVARGDNVPDALTIAPYLVWAKCPTALVDPSSAKLSANVKAIVLGASSIVALGGVRSVLEKLLAEARAASGGKLVERLDGKDRYEASAAIVEWEISHGMTLNGAGVATGEKHPDALTLSYLLGQGGSVLMLVSPTGSNAAMMDQIKSATVSTKPSLMRIIGGKASVPDSMYQLTSAVAWAAYGISAQGNGIKSKAAYVKSASRCSQMILVEASGTSAVVSLHEKDSSETWNEAMSASGYVGRGGVGSASERSPVTPAGSFDIPFAFGNASNPGTLLPWHDTTWESTWVDDSNTPYYNTWQESNDYSGECLKSIGWVYDYALVIGYNHPRLLRDQGQSSSYRSRFSFFRALFGGQTDGWVRVSTFTEYEEACLVGEARVLHRHRNSFFGVFILATVGCLHCNCETHDGFERETVSA